MKAENLLDLALDSDVEKIGLEYDRKTKTLKLYEKLTYAEIPRVSEKQFMQLLSDWWVEIGPVLVTVF